MGLQALHLSGVALLLLLGLLRVALLDLLFLGVVGVLFGELRVFFVLLRLELLTFLVLFVHQLLLLLLVFRVQLCIAGVGSGGFFHGWQVGGMHVGARCAVFRMRFSSAVFGSVVGGPSVAGGYD